MQKIRIGGWTYHIFYRPLTDDELSLLDEEPENVAGMCFRASKQIVILPEYKGNLGILLHEIGHAIDNEYGIYNIEDYETRATVFGNMLVQIIRDNPMLVRRIFEHSISIQPAQGQLDSVEIPVSYTHLTLPTN